jgi:hypothetical protein
MLLLVWHTEVSNASHRVSPRRHVSRTYLGDEGNNTPFFFIPVFLAGGCAYFILPLNLFVVMVIARRRSMRMSFSTKNIM